MADDVAEQITKEYFDKSLAAQMNPVPAQIGIVGTLEEQRDQRQWYLHRCVEALQEANKIRADDALMKELREYLRQKRDDLAILLDKIG